MSDSIAYLGVLFAFFTVGLAIGLIFGIFTVAPKNESCSQGRVERYKLLGIVASELIGGIIGGIFTVTFQDLWILISALFGEGFGLIAGFFIGYFFAKREKNVLKNNRIKFQVQI